MIVIKVNGSAHRIEAAPDTPLLWVIRDHLGLTGTKYCCGVGGMRRVHRACGR